MTNKDLFTFIVYRSWIDQYKIIKEVDKELAVEFLEGILFYGVYDEEPSNKQLKLYGIDNIIENIASAKGKYIKKVEDGKKGGRPREKVDMNIVHEMIEEGKTQKEIGEYFGVSSDTIGRRLKEEREGETAKPQNVPQNPLIDFETMTDLETTD